MQTVLGVHWVALAVQRQADLCLPWAIAVSAVKTLLSPWPFRPAESHYGLQRGQGSSVIHYLSHTLTHTHQAPVK